MGANRQFLRGIQRQMGRFDPMRDHARPDGSKVRGFRSYLRRQNEKHPGWWERFLDGKRENAQMRAKARKVRGTAYGGGTFKGAAQ